MSSAGLVNINYDDLLATGVFSSTGNAISWLRQHGLLRIRCTCHKCGSDMAEGRQSSMADGKTWRCREKTCRTTTSIRKGSFFEKANLDLITGLKLIFHWVEDELLQRGISRYTKLSKKTVVQWAAFLREICSEDLLRNMQQIGGPGHIVAIDESLVARRKVGNRQGRPVPQQWMFGGIDTTTKECFIKMVPCRDRATLEAEILRHIAPGTEIHSDEWRAYYNLTNLGYVHHTVNHRQRYVSATGVHTNHIENLWLNCKRKFRMNGTKRDMIPGYLDEFMWRHQRTREHYFPDILRAIGEAYPLP